jgi:prepilin-type N-terminal cleavage/methylation domain-containing protein
MRTAAIQRGRGGFTLMEVVISAALMALILISAYSCLRAAVLGQREVEPRVDILQNARVAAALLTADLRGACPLSTNYQFLGMRRQLGEVDADNMDFATHNYTPRGPREGDYCEISYFVDRDPETGQFALWRRRNPTLAPDPLSGGSREEIASGLLGVHFEYYDGLDWYDDWGDLTGKLATSLRDHPNLEGMPEAVRITLLFDSNPKARKPAQGAAPAEPPPPLIFQTVARLNLAGHSQPGSVAGASGNAGDNGETQGGNGQTESGNGGGQ